ncbi:MAG TPA: transketolase C-terminal domain-containing protein [Acidobacteriota bacterium]|nr:transketolase C-terminal domain-containing protein [Acidobacteriota bacterium]
MMASAVLVEPQTYQERLGQLAAEDDRIIVMTAENRAAIRDLPMTLGRRFLDVGICEQTLVGAAAGLALRGRIPVVHALAAFLTMRAFEFIRTDVGIAQLPVKLVGSFAGFLSEANGPTHQSLEDIALMHCIPGMEIFCPADEMELVFGLAPMLESRSPCYIRYNPEQAKIAHDPVLTRGKAELAIMGSDCAILTYGFMFNRAYQACELLLESGLSPRLINLRMLSPIDEEVIAQAAVETPMVITLEDHFLYGGLYTIVCEILVRRGIQTRVMPIGFEQRWFRPALLEDALHAAGMNANQIAEKIRNSL